jgi:LAO/AO transport system kinase
VAPRGDPHQRLKAEGLDEFWHCVTRFRDLQTANGKLAARRQQQARRGCGAIDAGLKGRPPAPPCVPAWLP